MKKILTYLTDYQRRYFDWPMYAIILVFTAICIFFNYRYDFEDGIIDAYTGHPIKWLWMFLFHGVPYLAVCLIISAFGKPIVWYQSRSFWIKFLIGFGLLAFDRSFYGLRLLQHYVRDGDYYFLYRCANWASSLVLVVIPMLLIYPLIEKDQPRIWYGLQWKKFDFKPYLFLLVVVAVFIGIGSFETDIKDFYPRYLKSYASLFLSNHPEVNEVWTVLLFEISYGLNFISVELVFRGFLIFAFTRTLGPYAVLPMAVTYAFLHFGKPLGETLSSIVGGYTLGIISLKSRSIWGGILIHLGVAWLMELFGWLQNLR